MSIAKDFPFQRPSGLITSSGQVERKNVTGYNLGIDLKSCDNNNNVRSSCRRDGNVKRKKSVSFEEDVVVYLFDQVLSACSLFFVFEMDKKLVHSPTSCCWFLGESHVEASL